ncbi:MAG TPA: helix-turn-helix transcriptional regulator [Pseudobdellovibrionaceae bacterium]|jgi:transcriptional regulator with XRE-family HTH domain
MSQEDIIPVIAESFASFLRRNRIATRKTMGQLARELGITVVYYSEVEAGRKPAFPDKKVDYEILASSLGTTENQIKKIADLDREKRQILKVFECDHSSADLAVAFGRRLSKNDLTAKQLSKIHKILNERE